MRKLAHFLTMRGRIIAAIAAFAFGDDSARANAEPPRRLDDYVVLLHGLGRTRFSMKRLEWTLKQANYRVVNLSWPSTHLSVQTAADWLGSALAEHAVDPAAKIHFVTHSLGGIVLRCYLADHSISNLGRVVMLAPPNHGSELADRLRGNFFYRFFTGPSGQQLGMEFGNVLEELSPPDFELGIIAGDRSLNPIFSSWISGPDDGKVSVRSARLEGASEFLVVHHSHTWMTWRRDVVLAVTRFLQNGSFQQAPATPAPKSMR
jgi:pimeloyl-ACP methyl ester carboxylesterase